MMRNSNWFSWVMLAAKPQRAKTRPAATVRRRSPRQLETLEDRTVLTAGVAATYAVTNDWASGFQSQMQLTNAQSTAVANWQLSFTFSSTITSIWDAQIVSHVGNQYVIQGAAWDNSIPASGSVSFGFVGSGSGAAPTNYAVNSVPLGGAPVVVPALSIGDVSVTDGSSGTINADFAVSLSAAATTPVTVAYATANGTAQAGADYQASQGVLTFAPGQTQQTVTVPVIPETTPAASKSFAVTLSSPSGATLARAQATGTILDNVPPPVTTGAQFQVTSNWGSGYSGQITVQNTSQQTITSWQLQFNFASQITSIWDASVVSHTGNQYVVTNAGWNAALAPGASLTFGFNASPGGSPAAPTNYLLTNVTTGAPSSTNHPPVAGNVSVLVNPGQTTAINVLAGASDPDGDPLSVTAITQPQHGAAVLNSDGTVSYTPGANYTGSDSFSYSVSDGRGGSATGSVSVSVGIAAATAAWPSQYFAPYVDMTLYPTYNLVTTAQTQGVKYFTLAFITADSNNQPAWGGYTTYEVNGGAFDMALRQQVSSLRALGGDVMVSFGGAANQELAQVITSVPQLTAAYQSVISAYNVTHLDFDIEGAAEADHASIDRRSQALASLEQTAAAAGHPLQIWFTLPVLPSGLTADGLYVLQSALKYGVQIAGVNIMTMDFGDSSAPNPQGQMGTYTIEAAESLFAQLGSLYGSSKTSAQLWNMVGLTPMIGVNDQTDEVFDLAAAQQVETFAQQQGIGRISMWSLNRDTQGTAKSYVDDTSSSITQQAFAFSHLFEEI